MTGQPDQGRNPWWGSHGGVAAGRCAVRRPGCRAGPLVLGIPQCPAGPVGRFAGSSRGPTRCVRGRREPGCPSRSPRSRHLWATWPGCSPGQADDVELSAENVEWGSYQFASVTARLSNVHTRFRARPVLVAAPIDLSLVVTGERLSAWLSQIVPALQFEITESARIFCTARPPPSLGVRRGSATVGTKRALVLGPAVGPRARHAAVGVSGAGLRRSARR